MSNPTPKTSRNIIVRRIALPVIALALIVVVLSWVQVTFFAASLPATKTTSSLHAAGLAKAIHLYAQDHDGKFPEGIHNSNEAFRRLFVEYHVNERLFFVPGCAWHDAAPNHRPDGEIGDAPDFARCLQKGENHWAYVSGLNTESSRQAPLIADGFVEGQPGTYASNPKKKGGRWKGEPAIVIFASGAAEHVKLSRWQNYRVLVEKPGSDQKIDLFTREGGLPENAKVLNPK